MDLSKHIKGLFPQKEKKKKSRMLILHRRQITALSLLILVGIAGYLNWSFQRDVVDPEVASVYNEVSKKLGEAKMVSGTEAEEAEETLSVTDYFSQAKLERDLKRGESMDMLAQILDAQNTDSKARTEAENQIHTLSDYTEKEVMMENLIRAKGFSDAFVFMSENLISVAVQAEALNEVDAAVIQDIATSTSGMGADTVKIVTVN